jgi:hypothetical protein
MVVVMRIDTNIHNVAKIEIGERRFHASETNPFWAREIVITDVDGHSHTLNLYSNSHEEDEALKVTT